MGTSPALGCLLPKKPGHLLVQSTLRSYPDLPHSWVGLTVLHLCSCRATQETLRDPMDCSLPGSSAPGVFQARVLEWVAIAFSTYSLWWIAKKCIELFVKRNEIIHIKQLERYLEHCRYKVHCCFPSSNIFCSILSKQDGSCGCRTPLPWSPVQCLL